MRNTRDTRLKTAFAATLLVAFAGLGLAAAPVLPRKSPELTFTDTSGKPVSLSSYKGKVVLLAFMYTTCPHCQREAQMVTKLQQEYGPRGFQALGIAFNFTDKEAPAVRAATVSRFNQEFGVGFPTGHSGQEAVQVYLGLSVMDRYVVPQIALLDRQGNIVKQSDPTMGSEELQTESTLRAAIEKLLGGGATTSNKALPTGKAVAATKAAATK